MEGEPLIPGGYAGPYKARAHAPPSFTRRLTDWFVAITLPVGVFIGAVLLQGPYKHKSTVDPHTVVIVATLTFFVFTVVSFRSFKMMRGFIGLLCLFAAVTGALAGVREDYLNFNIIHQFTTLVTYVNIDPSKDVGGAYMDAGEVYFKEGSRVDTQRGIAVRSKDTYCAAPIVREEAKGQAAQANAHPPPAGTVDWWAVGKNCCDPSGEGFTCGLSGLAPQMTPRAGLRQLYDYERHLYRLAVDEWASKFNLPVKHPLFFEWVVDPIADVTGRVLKGWSNVYKWIELHAAVNFVIGTLGTSVVVELLEA